VSNDLLAKHHPGSLRPWTALEFLLVYDQAETLNVNKSLAAWARESNRSSGWIKARVIEYRSTSDSIRVNSRRRSKETPAKPDPSEPELFANSSLIDRQSCVNSSVINTPHPSYTIQDTEDKNIYSTSKAIAQLLAASVRTRRPGAAIPTRLDAWSKEIGKIPAPPEQITSVIQWLFSPGNEGEYSFEVQSASSLRKKFGRIVAKIERDHAKNQRPDPSNPSNNVLDAGLALVAAHRSRKS
jgi:hypothetical protein